MVFALISFELRRRLKMLSSWVYAVVFFVAALLLMLAAGGVFKSVSTNSGAEKVMANSPHSLFTNIGTLSLFGLLAVAAIFGQAAYQDFGHETWQIIFTKNVKKGPYLMGRFLGAYVFSALLLLAIAGGLLFGTGIVALLEPKQLTHFNLWAYVWPFVVQVWPMLFTGGALFFALAALTRRMAPVYVGVVVLVMGYLAISAALGDVQNQTAGALLDPFGFFAFDVVTRYWSPAERNSQLVGLTGLLLANRAIWSVVGVGLLGLAVARFKPMVEEQKRGASRSADDDGAASPPSGVALPSTPASPAWVRTMASTGWLSFLDVVRSPVYWSFLVSGFAFVMIIVAVSKQMFGTATLPVTYQVLELAQGGFRLFAIITITFYAGELVWREKDAGLDDIVAATRTPNWVMFGSKFIALLLVAASLQVVVGAAALGWQLSKGFFDIEPRLYAVNLVVFGFLGDVALCALALVVQWLINQKYLGHFAMVVYYVLASLLALFGIEERLLMYGSEPRPRYSDLNGYGQRLEAVAVFRVYWWAWAAVLLTVAWLFMVRGREASWAARRVEARRRFTGPARVIALLSLATAAAAGAFIFYETHVLNPYETSKDEERQQAQYEKTYKAYAALPQPTITALEVAVDVYPDEPRLDARGTYRVKNKTDAPITKVLVGLGGHLVPKVLTLAGQTEKTADLTLGEHEFELKEPLAPGAEADLVFDLTFEQKGFTQNGGPRAVVGNGTFINNGWFPRVGYNDNAELVEDNDRKKYDLPPKERMRERDDPQGLAHNYIRQDSDFITFKATVSTSGDQVPIAPGTVVREWSENGRNYAQFETEQPILNFVSFLSARYTRTQDEWNGVKLEIDHHPKHTANIARMMKGLKDSLAYCSENFGPYQHQHARIVEFPRYQQFAQSFPNTIPYSEAIGFIAQVREGEPDDIDYPYYVTAHEIAHQWFAHQVVGGNTQGATLTSETLSQYAALMVMKHTYGTAKMRRFLKYELDRYLMGRTMEQKKELPLGRVENQQYIHYAKGSLAMYALQDLIGEDRVNRALKKYVAKVRFQGPPYTNSTELISYLREETPDEQKELIDDLFERIVLYDNRAVSAKMRPVPGGAYEVTLHVKSTKYRADEDGKQVEVDSNDVINVGAVDEKGDALLLEKRRVPKGESDLTFVVPSKPSRVGIDPMNELVDRTSDDNLTTPDLEGE